MVIMEAWERGVEVFRNVGCTGKMDLVFARNTGDLLSVDVGLAQRNGQGVLGASGKFYAKTATPVLVNPVTKVIRWVRGKEPAGWENFWD